MSALVPFTSNAGLPAHLQAIASAFGMEPLSSSPPRISTDKGRFQIFMEGQAIGGFRNELSVVILGVAPAANLVQRTFFAGQYDPSGNSPKIKPSCWSGDGKTPAADAPDKQSTRCDSCPKNEKGSGTMPGTKACRYGKHVLLAVVGQDGNLIDSPFLMRLSAQGIFAEAPTGSDYYSLRGYQAELTARQANWGMVVTKVHFPEGSTGGVRFTPMHWVPTTEMANALVAMAGSADALDALAWASRDAVAVPDEDTPPAPQVVTLQRPAKAATKPAPAPAPTPVAEEVAEEVADEVVEAPAPAPKPAPRQAPAPAPVASAATGKTAGYTGRLAAALGNF